MAHTSPVESDGPTSLDFNSNDGFDEFLNNDSPRYSDEGGQHLGQHSKSINGFEAIPMDPLPDINPPIREQKTSGFDAIPMDEPPKPGKIPVKIKPKTGGSRLLRSTTIDKAIDTGSMMTADVSLLNGPSAIPKVPTKQKGYQNEVNFNNQFQNEVKFNNQFQNETNFNNQFQDDTNLNGQYQDEQIHSDDSFQIPAVSEITSTLNPPPIPPIPKKLPISQSSQTPSQSISGPESFQLFTQLPPIPLPPSNENPLSAKNTANHSEKVNQQSILNRNESTTQQPNTNRVQFVTPPLNRFNQEPEPTTNFSSLKEKPIYEIPKQNENFVNQNESKNQWQDTFNRQPEPIPDFNQPNCQETQNNRPFINRIDDQNNLQQTNNLLSNEMEYGYQQQSQDVQRTINQSAPPYQPLFYGPLGSLEMGFVYSFNKSISTLKRMFNSEFNTILKKQQSFSNTIDSFDINEFTDQLSAEISQIIETPVQPLDTNQSNIIKRVSNSITDETKVMTTGLKEIDAKNQIAKDNQIAELKKLHVEVDSLKNVFKTTTDQILLEVEKERSDMNSMKDFNQHFLLDLERRSRSIQIKQVELNTKISHQNIEKETIERSLKQLNQKKQTYNSADPFNPERGANLSDMILNEIRKIKEMIKDEMSNEDEFSENSSSASDEAIQLLQEELNSQKAELMNLQLLNRYSSQQPMLNNTMNLPTLPYNQTSFQPSMMMTNDPIRRKNATNY